MQTVYAVDAPPCCIWGRNIQADEPTWSLIQPLTKQEQEFVYKRKKNLEASLSSSCTYLQSQIISIIQSLSWEIHLPPCILQSQMKKVVSFPAVGDVTLKSVPSHWPQSPGTRPRFGTRTQDFFFPVDLQSLKDLGNLTYRFHYLFRQMVGLLGRVISPSQGLYLHRTTQHRKTRTNNALSGIRTYDPSNQPAKTHASDCTATVTGRKNVSKTNNIKIDLEETRCADIDWIRLPQDRVQ
jgi:hypothetical protein